MYVCLSVRFAYLKKPHFQISPVFRTLIILIHQYFFVPVAAAQSSFAGNAIRHALCTSSFVDDVMFLHNGAAPRRSVLSQIFVVLAAANRLFFRATLYICLTWRHVSQQATKAGLERGCKAASLANR